MDLLKWLRPRASKGIGDMAYADESHWRVSGSGSGTRVILPGSKFDWAARVGQPWSNSAAYIGINWIAQSFPEATLSVASSTGDGDEMDPEHPLAVLWNTPNPAYSGAALTAGVVASLLCDGNAYLAKVRGRAGSLIAPVELHWLQHWRVEPVSDKANKKLVDHYEYRHGNGQVETIPLSEVVHLRYGMDLGNPRKGLSPLRALLREIATDNEAITFVASILTNMGVPSMLLSPADNDVEFTDESQKLVELIQRRTTGDERGKPVILNFPARIDTPALTPSDLALADLTEQATSRILAAMGLSAMAVGLPDSQRTYSNAQEARRSAWENAVLPLMATIEDGLDAQLLPEFKPAQGQHVRFDVSEIAAMQEDVLQRDTRARQNYVAGIWMRSEARTETGKDATPEDDVYVDEVKAQIASDQMDRQIELEEARTANAPEKPEPNEPAPGAPPPGAQKALEPAPEPSPWTERVMAELATLVAQEGADDDDQS
jgi:HK97 family phage portal protein